MKKALLALTLLLASPAVARAGEVTMVSRDVPLAGRSLQAAAAPIRFNLLGLHWRGPGAVEFRTRAVGGGWSPWQAAEADLAPDPAERRSRGWHDGNLAWTGPSDRAQFRTRGAVTRLRAFYLWSAPARAPVRRLSVAGSPEIVSRASWLADEKIRHGKVRYAPSVRLAVVHHTAGRNTYTPDEAAAIVRGIETYHVKANGWNDIGYNFLVDRFGTVYEGRAGGIDRNVIGAHALGFNTGSVGVALIGNFSKTAPPKAAQDALVDLLAWRLDVAHLDPLSRVTIASGGNAKFRAGRPVTLRAISGHRDTGPSACPGQFVERLLPAIARRVAATGLPKLYAPSVTGRLGEKLRFQARLSSPGPWSVSVVTAAGKVVARGAGKGALVDWTWDSTGAGKGPFRWRIDAGDEVLPAEGSIGRTPSGGGGPAPAPAPAPLPALLSGLAVSPATLAAAGGGDDGLVTVAFTLAAPARVDVRVTRSPGGAVAATPLSSTVAAGRSSFRFDLSALQEGRYRLTVTARRAGSAPIARAAVIAVDRTLTGLAVSSEAVSPNGDGVADGAEITFTLSRQTNVQVNLQRGSVYVATLHSGPLSIGAHTIPWDGTAAGAALPDGDYLLVVTADGPYGPVTLVRPVRVDTKPPSLTLLDGPSLRFRIDEPARVSVTVNGQVVDLDESAGAFALAWAGGAVTSLSAQARDGSGNGSPVVSWSP